MSMLDNYLTQLIVNVCLVSTVASIDRFAFDTEGIKLPKPIDNAIGSVIPKQKVCVRGKLTCLDNPEKQAGVTLKLWDIDTWNPDDLMSKAKSDEDGFFDFCGEARDIAGDIEPVLKVYHRCKVSEHEHCDRKFRIQIPLSFLGKTYEMIDEIGLDEKRHDEGRKCA